MTNQGGIIYYLLGDDPTPSWGAGMIYEHVRLLRQRGFDARVLHETSPYRPPWITVDVPIAYRNDARLAPGANDVVVVPEVLAADPIVAKYPWRRVVFVQGSFLILSGLEGARDYADLGYTAAMAVLPHIAHIVERYFGVDATVVPPYPAPYFADDGRPRERRILFSAKEGYRLAGVPDHDIAQTLLSREVAKRAGWSLVALENMTHGEVAELMKSSMFLVNVNSHESFNATVPEAMAAGCVAVCYEATGGRDYLRDGENAIVFDNQQVYALVERVCELMDHFEQESPALATIRSNALRTAASFNAPATGAALSDFFSVRFGMRA